MPHYPARGDLFGYLPEILVTQNYGWKKCLLNSLLMIIIIYSGGKKNILYYWVLHVLNNDSIILKIDTLALGCCAAATGFEFSYRLWPFANSCSMRTVLPIKQGCFFNIQPAKATDTNSLLAKKETLWLWRW